MLTGLAVALALTAPVPLPRPAPETPAVERSAAGATVTVTSVPVGPGTGGSGPKEVGVEDPLAVPLPPERPVAGTGGDGVTAQAEPEVAGPAAPVESVPAARPGDGDSGAVPETPLHPGAAMSPRPVARPDPDAPVIRAMLPVPGGSALPGTLGVAPRSMVCRDPRITGEPAASFAGNIPGCGIFEPVRVASISGVGMSEPITVSCPTARAFADWLTGVAQPAASEMLGSRIRSLRIMGSYTCRSQNNRPGARLSEHSAGRAVDLGGVMLADGRRITVRDDWRKGAAGTFLRRVWKGACGGFTTVIGPDRDRHHQDHLHLDTAYRGSTYCR